MDYNNPNVTSKTISKNFSALAEYVIMEGGIVTKNVLEKSLDRSLIYGWEYSLCLGRLLTLAQERKTFLYGANKSLNYARNIAEKMAKRLGFSPSEITHQNMSQENKYLFSYTSFIYFPISKNQN